MEITAKYLQDLREKTQRLRSQIRELESSQKYKRKTKKFFKYLNSFIGGGLLLARHYNDIIDNLHLKGFGHSSDTYSEPQEFYYNNRRKITHYPFNYEYPLFETIKRPRPKGWKQIKKKIQEEVAFENN